MEKKETGIDIENIDVNFGKITEKAMEYILVKEGMIVNWTKKS
jgi:hypothetical protein